MQEVLTKPGYENLFLTEREFYEISLDESNHTEPPSFVVKQAHYIWSGIDQQFMFDELQTEHFAILEKAQERYEARRRVLMKQGYSHSDMEF
jgi:hypothetical protein